MKHSIAKFIEIIDEKNLLVTGLKTEIMKLRLDDKYERADIEVLSNSKKFFF